jgi:hypothetical protein
MTVLESMTRAQVSWDGCSEVQGGIMNPLTLLDVDTFVTRAATKSRNV